MEESILKSTKKTLGLDSEYTAFDPDVVTFINSVLSDINQLGVGPEGGLTIEDDQAVWDDLDIPPNQLNTAKTLIYLKVRMMFDPPPTSFAIEAMNKQIEQQEWRLSIFREGLIPVTTTTVTVDPIDGDTIITTTEEAVTW